VDFLADSAEATKDIERLRIRIDEALKARNVPLADELSRVMDAKVKEISDGRRKAQEAIRELEKQAQEQ
jgi:hypothetical protein